MVSDRPSYEALFEELFTAALYDVSASFVMDPMKHSTALPLWPPDKRRSLALKATRLIIDVFFARSREWVSRVRERDGKRAG